MIDSKEVTEIAVRAADSKHAEDVRVLNIGEISIVADYFVIMSAGSNRQVAAIVDEITDKIEEAGGEVNHIEGKKDSKWILIDANGVVIHVFLNEEREFYNLEKLWSDAEEMDISEWVTEA